jgi:alpha-mannosidase
MSLTAGFGAGDVSVAGRMTSLSVGPEKTTPVVVVNTLPFARSEMVTMKVWNKDLPTDRVAVRDASGRTVPGQVIGRSQYSNHEGFIVLFPAENVPAAGYKAYCVCAADEPVSTDDVKTVAPGVIENEFLRVEVDLPSGAIKHLIDKPTGCDYVPEGELMGLLELYQEAPHNMSGWDIGKIEEMKPLTTGAEIDESERQQFLEGSEGLGMVNSWTFPETGPNRTSIRTVRKVGSSRVVLQISLSAGSPAVDISVIAHWKEVGTPLTGVPMLKIAFPTAITNPTATYEIPFGHIVRPANGQEVPALAWADLSGDSLGSPGKCGITVLNDHKYGHSADGSTLRVTLLRSTYDPDPVPEMGTHRIRLSIIPHQGLCSVSDATRAGAAFNLPMSVAGTNAHDGNLPSEKGTVEILTPNVTLSALKKAEDSDALIVRLYEMDGRDTEARIRLTDIVKPGSAAVEVDLMEQPLTKSSAKMDADVLIVKIPAYGIVSVALG